MDCRCTVTMPDDWQIQEGNTLTFDVGPIIIKYCPLHAAAPETHALLERFRAFLQDELLQNIQTLSRGQTLIDAGWNLVAELHALNRAQATQE